MNKIVCVYQIRNIVTGDLYIGSAIDYNRRVTRHLYFLRNGKHHSRYLQNAFNKYGEVNFVFESIELISDLNVLTIREQYWLDKLTPAYNTMKDIKSHIGVKRSAETIQKLSLAQMGKKCPEHVKEKIRQTLTGTKQSSATKQKRVKSMYQPILQLDRKTGALIKEWESATTAATTLGYSRVTIYESANQRREPFKDYIWRFKHETKNN
jgi:group I intron endonuclease